MRGAVDKTLLGAALGLCTLAGIAGAAEVHGTAQVIGGTVENNGEETDVTQQNYQLTLVQRFTPFLSVNLSYLHDKDRSASPTSVFEREQSLPRFSLLYSRPDFTARLDYYEQENSGTAATSNFERSSALAYFSWRPKKGPGYVLQYRDESNVADTATFGRDTDSEQLQFDAVYDADNWGLRFSHADFDLENNLSGYRLDQTRDQVRADLQRSWKDGRYSLAAETWVSRVDQTQVAPTGSSLAQPIGAADGLFDIDLTPSFGTLSSSPGLTDGNVVDPVQPLIEIGSAQTGRNIGLDLGFTQPVTRLEISVDAPSDAGLVWEVYHSPDNFNWTLAGLVSTLYDSALNRYTLRFPEITARYFKAVNVTVNGFANVNVTELRALVDVDTLGRSSAESRAYRLDLVSRLEPHDLVRGRIQLYVTNDEDVAGGRISQDVDQFLLGTDWTIELGHHLTANAEIRISEFEQNISPGIRRDVTYYGAEVAWNPRETVRGLFQVTRNDESDDGQGIRTTDQTRMRWMTEIYPNLIVTSELSKAIVEDRFGGFTQDILRWTESVEAEPTRDWRFGGTTTLSWFDSVGIQTVSRRIGVEFFTSWRIAPYLTFTGSVGYTEDDVRENVNQRHALSWSPGRKLSASIYFQDSDSVDTRRVTSGGASVSYRLNRRILLFANASYSDTEEFGVLTTEVTNVRLGLRATF